MNLHDLVAPAIGLVNPETDAWLEVSTGETIADDGRQTPTYAPRQRVRAQVQSVTAKDIEQLEGLNLQNIRNTIYLYGQVSGIVRAQNKGGDKITMDDGTVWLVAAVLEQWPDWVKVGVTMQLG